MNSQGQQKRPMSPQQLFQRLMSGNFKEAECVDQVARIREQRDILISLISQYSAEIEKRMVDQTALQQQLEMRARLRLQLQSLREQRVRIDRNIADEVNRFKLTPIQIRQQSQWSSQLEQTRAKNAKLGVRLRQLTQYCARIQNYNLMLEEQGRVIKAQMRTRAFSEHAEIEDWRKKIELMKQQRQNYSRQIRMRIKQREQMSLRQIHHQQAQIAQRNRQRIQSFHQKSKLGGYY